MKIEELSPELHSRPSAIRARLLDRLTTLSASIDRAAALRLCQLAKPFTELIGHRLNSPPITCDEPCSAASVVRCRTVQLASAVLVVDIFVETGSAEVQV